MNFRPTHPGAWRHPSPEGISIDRWRRFGSPLERGARLVRRGLGAGGRAGCVRALAACFATALAAFAQTPVAPATPAPNPAKNPAPLRAPLNPALPTIFIAGDSTAARGRGEHQQGWGVPFADYFDPAKVNVANRAIGGRSSKTFIVEGAWDRIVADLKAGDIVLIQFSHNDGSPVAEDPSTPRSTWRFRGSIPGLGEETKEIDNLLTNKHEVVHTYGWYMRKMIADTKAKGAKPIVVSSTLRNLWKDGKIERGPGQYTPWSFEIAKAAQVPFIDLTNTLGDRFDEMGEAAVKALYEQDHTHFNLKGADLHASTVVAGLKGWRLPVVTNALSEKGQAVAADRMSWLRLGRPANPALPSLILVGDSTVRQGQGDGADGGQWGWGDCLAPYFDPTKINIVNRAVGGTGVQSYLVTHWPGTLALVKAGDVVTIQFGHNDNPPRGPLPGIGKETGERENPRTKEKQVLHTWGWYLRQYIADIRAKGATPVVCSLIPRKIWKEGKVVRNQDTFAGWARQVAAAEHVGFIDLNEEIARRYDEIGPEKVEPLFADPHTHTTLAGAEFNAKVVIDGLKALPQNPVAAYLK
jgi:lysophospholipase L1-like esterase